MYSPTTVDASLCRRNVVKACRDPWAACRCQRSQPRVALGHQLVRFVVSMFCLHVSISRCYAHSCTHQGSLEHTSTLRHQHTAIFSIHLVLDVVIVLYRLCRMNAANWQSGIMPQAGDVVSFPDSFANFGSDRCTTATSTCRVGGVISIQAPAGQETATLSFAKWNLPSNGKFSFKSDTKINLVAANTSSPRETSWLDRGAKSTDFKCANNWVVTGTTTNPNFTIPCYQDKASFLEVSVHLS